MLSESYTQNCPCCGQPTNKPFIMDETTRTVTFKGRLVVLNYQQFVIFQKLVEDFPKATPYESLFDVLDRITRSEDMYHYTKVIVSFIRTAIRPLKLGVRNIPGFGYRIYELGTETDAKSVLSNKGSSTAWTDEHVNKLEELVSRKYTASQIASIMRMPYRTIQARLKLEGLI